MTDIHSHILFGLDDGSQDMKTSKRMLAAAQAVGVNRIVATPHVRRLPFDFEAADERYRVMSRIASEKGMRIDMGYEVHWNALLAFDERTFERLCFQGTRTMLLEFSLSADELPQGHDQMIYRLQRCGIQIIIAHPERYPFVQARPSIAERWRDMGCHLQLDVICLIRASSLRCKYTARKLLKADVYDYMASDAHCPEDYALYRKALAWAEKRA